MSRYVLASTFALATTVLGHALPNPFPSPTVAARGIVLSEIVNVLPTTIPKDKEGMLIADPPEYLTITVINSHGDAISTSHVHDADSPSAVGGVVTPGTMANGATATAVYPTGWAGNIAINDAGFELTGDDSLIEASFVDYEGVAVVDVDVSYVNGFSVAIVCWCTVDDNSPSLSGCNKNLFDLNTCPDNDGENACVNPLRADTDATEATTFFAPCQGAAYTFPDDNDADSWGACQSGGVTCCVGMDCPASTKQSS